MILPDTNLLIYASDPSGHQHERAKRWWEKSLNGSEGIALPWPVVVSYLRLMSSPRVRLRPTPVALLLDAVEEWCRSPMVRLVHPKPTHLQAMRSIAEPLGLAGDVLNDVHLAALSIEYGAVVHTADRDFGRFRGVRWRNPLD